MYPTSNQIQGFGAPQTSIQPPQLPSPVANMGGSFQGMPTGQDVSGIGVMNGQQLGQGYVGAGGGGMFSANSNFMQNVGGWQGIASGIQTIGNLYMAYQQNKLAKDSLNFQKDSFNKNLANQTQSYNTSLEDKIRSRYVTEGRSSDEADDYLEKNRL